MYIGYVYTVFIPGHKLQILNEHWGATLLRGYTYTEYVPTRGIVGKNNPLIIDIFIGLVRETNKIGFFSKSVYVQLAHMLGQIHTLDVY